jgi:hypothetical protein
MDCPFGLATLFGGFFKRKYPISATAMGFGLHKFYLFNVDFQMLSAFIR